jgi:hypothetical protein
MYAHTAGLRPKQARCRRTARLPTPCLLGSAHAPFTWTVALAASAARACVADDRVELADGIETTFDAVVNGLCRGDVCVGAAVLAVDGSLEGRDVGGQLSKKICGEFVFDKVGFERCDTGGKGACGAQPRLVVTAARQAEALRETGRVEVHRAGGAVDGFHVGAQRGARGSIRAPVD